MKTSILALVLLTLSLLLNQPAKGETRVAWVVGNNAYQHGVPLKNPINDAKAVASALRKKEFGVVSSLDLTNEQLTTELRRFSDRSRKADVILFFFAGHGVEVNGTNYLVPVDATITNEGEVAEKTLSLDRIMKALGQTEARLRIIILDCCRDRPFGNGWKPKHSKGLAETTSVADGTAIIYSASPGSVALDGTGENSPFSGALVEEMEREGLDLIQVFQFTGQKVAGSTNGAQRPWIYTDFYQDFFFAKPSGKVDSPVRHHRVPEGMKYEIKIADSPIRFQVVNPETRDQEMTIALPSRKTLKHPIPPLFYGFRDHTEVDFDGDDTPDHILSYAAGAGGSGNPVYTACLSSKTQNLIVYQHSEGTSWWIDIPNQSQPFAIVERGGIPGDWQDQAPVGEWLSSAERPDFLFTHQWDGQGFSFRPVPEFYAVCLPSLLAAKDAADDGSWKETVFDLISEPFRNAANDQPIAPEIRSTSGWKEILRESDVAIRNNIQNPSDRVMAAQTAVAVSGEWGLVEDVEEELGDYLIRWQFHLSPVGDEIRLFGRKTEVNGKPANKTEKLTRWEGRLKLSPDGSWTGRMRESSLPGRVMETHWNLDFTKQEKLSGVCRNLKGEVVSTLKGNRR